ncbi:MAG: N-acetylmuramoyl-L-alanine amidase [Oscillochloridaceae bacterium]|nr:N-acetylmuramoyl-L-alanine amidase [Chloroflexaceae bacterium]MDW8390921.1 N-acetylmuramoyl-L-alanine amidase [Oscillochloridaceae bacterium]
MRNSPQRHPARRPWLRPWQLLSLAVLLACLSFCGVPIAQAPLVPHTPPEPATATAVAAPTVGLAPETAPIVTLDPAAPRRIGLQAGHWRIEEHPDEQASLRRFSGAYYRGYDEWELNIIIARQTMERLEDAGVTVDLLPAMVPPGYLADGFVSIHVDGATGAQAATRRGWKLATPFRASAASLALAEEMSAAYPRITGLPEDPHGPSYDMRAYYAFAYYRYHHSIAPETPAVILEAGFMTHPADRELLFGRPDLIAEGIARGVLDYLAGYDPADAAARAPAGRTLLRPAREGAPLYARPDEQSAIECLLARHERLAPMADTSGWVLVFTRGGNWDLGWVRSVDVEDTGEPLAPRP